MALVGEPERERAVARLQRHYAEGRLDHEELSDRLGLVLRARSSWQIAYALRSLPRLDDVRLRARHVLLLAVVGTTWLLFSAAMFVALVVWLVTNGVTLAALLFPAVWLAVSASLYRRTVVSRRRLPR